MTDGLRGKFVNFILCLTYTNNTRDSNFLGHLKHPPVQPFVHSSYLASDLGRIVSLLLSGFELP